MKIKLLKLLPGVLIALTLSTTLIPSAHAMQREENCVEPGMCGLGEPIYWWLPAWQW